MTNEYGPLHKKAGYTESANSVISDYAVQSTQADPGQHFPLPIDLYIKCIFLKQKIT